MSQQTPYKKPNANEYYIATVSSQVCHANVSQVQSVSKYVRC